MHGTDALHYMMSEI